MDSQLLWFASRATGAVSLTLFSAVMVLGALTARRAAIAGLGRAGILRLHRSMSLTALVFLAVHIVTAILDGYVDIGLLDVVVPFLSGYAPLFVGLGTVVLDLGIAIGITSALRTRLSPKVWKAVHWSAYAMWPLAMLHGIFTPGGDADAWWMQLVLAVNLAAVLVAVGWRVRRDQHPDATARSAADQQHRRAAELVR